jgi:hypothetical protein
VETSVVTLGPDPDRCFRNSKFIAACGAHDKDTGTPKANLAQAQTLFNQGVDVDFQDADMWTALFHASGEGHLHVVEWLIEKCNATVDMKDGEGCTPLWVACFNGRRNVVQVCHIFSSDVI